MLYWPCYVIIIGGTTVEKEREPFAEWLLQEMRQRGLNNSGLAQLVGVQPNTARSWVETGTAPRPENVRAISRVFGVHILSVYVILGWLEPEEVPGPAMSPKQRSLVEKVLQVGAGQMGLVEAQIDAVLRHQGSAR